MAKWSAEFLKEFRLKKNATADILDKYKSESKGKVAFTSGWVALLNTKKTIPKLGCAKRPYNTLLKFLATRYAKKTLPKNTSQTADNENDMDVDDDDIEMTNP